MTNTELDELLEGQPADVQEEILDIKRRPGQLRTSSTMLNGDSYRSKLQLPAFARSATQHQGGLR